MEFLPNLAALAGLHILMAMVPGPNTVVVSWLSATRTRRDGFLAVAGVVLASLVWVTLALWGVGAVLLEAGGLYRALRLAGAAYLVYLGVRMIRAGLGNGAATAGGSPRLSRRGPFATGLMTTLGNPKSAVFWTSAFLVAVPQTAPGWVYAAILVIVSVQSALWYGAVALFFSTGFARAAYLALARYLDLAAGGVMVFLGLRLADEVRRELAARAAS